MSLDELPNETLATILSQLPVSERIAFQVVNKRWRVILREFCSDHISLARQNANQIRHLGSILRQQPSVALQIRRLTILEHPQNGLAKSGQPALRPICNEHKQLSELYQFLAEKDPASFVGAASSVHARCCAMWRQAMYSIGDSRVDLAEIVARATKCSRLDMSVGSQVTGFAILDLLHEYSKLQRTAGQTPFKALKGLRLKCDQSKALVPIYENLDECILNAAGTELDFDLADFQLGQPTALKVVAIQGQYAIHALKGLVETGRLSHITKIYLDSFCYAEGTESDLHQLFDDMGTQCRGLQVLSVDFQYQESEDDSLVQPLDLQSLRNLSVRAIRLHVDVILSRLGASPAHGRNMDSFLENVIDLLPSSVETFELSGLLEADLESIERDLQSRSIGTLRPAKKKLRSVTIVVEHEEATPQAFLARCEDILPCLESLSMTAKNAGLDLGWYMRSFGDSDELLAGEQTNGIKDEITYL
ncbi:hypothetical protein NX059_012325 [Plenodomus lindquistii]|nr:hypothetical protein NX059_012325 [Plenodomus lindquistii]